MAATGAETASQVRVVATPGGAVDMAAMADEFAAAGLGQGEGARLLAPDTPPAVALSGTTSVGGSTASGANEVVGQPKQGVDLEAISAAEVSEDEQGLLADAALGMATDIEGVGDGTPNPTADAAESQMHSQLVAIPPRASARARAWPRWPLARTGVHSRPRTGHSVLVRVRHHFALDERGH